MLPSAPVAPSVSTGRLANVSELKFWLISPLSVLSNGAAASTVTCSPAVPTSSMTSTRTTWATPTTSPGRTNLLNPGIIADSSYVPTGNWGNVKFPVSELPAWYAIPVATFFASTVTPGTTAPLASDTVPVIVPRSDCANAATTENNKQTTNDRKYFFICRFSSVLTTIRV